MSAADERLLALIDRLTAILDRSDLTELEIEAGGTGVVLRKPDPIAQPAVQPAAARPARAPGASEAAADQVAAPTPAPDPAPPTTAPDLDALHLGSLIALVDEDRLRLPVGEDFNLLDRLGQRVPIKRVARQAAHADHREGLVVDQIRPG